jgi:hypothetical protein
MSTAFPKLMPDSYGNIKIPKDAGAGGIRTVWNNLFPPLVSVPANLATQGVPIRMQRDCYFFFRFFVNRSNWQAWIHGGPNSRVRYDS